MTVIYSDYDANCGNIVSILDTMYSFMILKISETEGGPTGLGTAITC